MIRRRKAPLLAVSEARGLRTLHLGGEAIQSAMRVDHPFDLALDYTRCMMAFLLFHPRPREALMIGLGGGSLAKFFHRRLRTTRVRAVECDARVLAAAREHFMLPPDDGRLSVMLGDGAEALAPECCDLLIVDGFDDGEQVTSLASADFYDAAYLSLAEPGAMVVNFLSDDPHFDRYLRRLERSFGGAVLAMPALSDPNVVAFALKGAPRAIEWTELAARAARLEARLELPFRRYVAALRRMNRHCVRELIISEA
ncbi:MAG: spermidine synthase [Betaproteobacteria bacterium]|nr:spermidine synthase [Betaproteobacteria bacterium]